MIRVGSLVTCKNDGYYRFINNRTLCVVIKAPEDDPDYIHVKIIASIAPKSLNKKFSVDKSNFKEITISEYFTKYPNAYKCQNFDKILKEYNIKYDNADETINTYEHVIPEEQKKELREEMITLLEQYGYHPTELGINKEIDEWYNNKYSLIKLFEKHPNYNGKYQIVFDTDFKREINDNIIAKFREYLKNTFEKVHQAKISCFTYDELNDITNKLYYIIDVMSSLSCYDGLYPEINGHEIEYYKKEYNRFCTYIETLKKKDIICLSNLYITREMYRKWDRLDDIIISIGTNSVKECLPFCDEHFSEFINERFPEVKAVKGQKVSRIINKLCCMFGLDKDEEYNKKFAMFSDTINPLMIKRHTVFSIHPVDYFTMSFGNSWASCQTIDKENIRDMPDNYHGSRSSGTLSYMLDGVSAILYTVDKSYNGNKLELEPKINRNMFHIGEDKIVQGRLYPQCNDGNDVFYTKFREIAQKIIADCMGRPNIWLKKKYVGEYVETTGTHYTDYTLFSSCNVSFLKDDSGNINENEIEIGHYPICPICGEEHYSQENICCNNCLED